MKARVSTHRGIAALALCQLAAAQAGVSQEVVDQLLVRLGDIDTRAAAANELLQHGRAAVPALAKRLLAIGQEKPEAWVAPKSAEGKMRARFSITPTLSSSTRTAPAASK